MHSGFSNLTPQRTLVNYNAIWCANI